MLGIKFFKADPTVFVLHYKNGAVKRQGSGLSFFYFDLIESERCIYLTDLSTSTSTIVSYDRDLLSDFCLSFIDTTDTHTPDIVVIGEIGDLHFEWFRCIIC